jgi:uncharacterized protein with GYD domain
MGSGKERAPVRAEEETEMETYIILGKWTQQGAAAVKQSPARIEATRKAIEAAGGKMLSWYLTMGRYDFIVIAEAPNAQAAAAVLLSYGTQGVGHTETLRAFSEDEFKKIVAGLP